jgi:hypothetical protein
MTPAQLNQKINALVKKWRKRMMLDRWTMRVKIGYFNDADDRSKAANASLPEYEDAELYFDVARIAPNEDLEELVVHELVHSLVSPLVQAGDKLAGENEAAKELVRAANERSTTWITRALLGR